MDQQPNTTPGVRLPQPSLEPMVAQPMTPTQYATPQYVPQQMTQPAQPMPVAPVSPQPSAPTPQLSQAPTTTAPVATTPIEEGDSQDEEWVAKAKDIANTYKNDPHAQSSALSKLRAEYLSKQHGMTVKVGEK